MTRAGQDMQLIEWDLSSPPLFIAAFACGVVAECPLCDALAAQVLLVSKSMVGYECKCGCSWRQKANKFQRVRHA